ncbi:MAG: signal recognition particle-docking protein FtsY [Alphaproteobacteria bacterium]|nr:signal recognition particle-docking protein FtsY [Alphaproteobacteria bacterium]
MSFFQKLKQGLKKTSTKLSDGLKSVFVHKKLDQHTLDELYDLLLMSDLGVPVSDRIIKVIRTQKFDKDITVDDVKEMLVTEIVAILEPCAVTLEFAPSKPAVILVVGVNGTGKTTTIAKLARRWQQEKQDVRLAAADTFRAAAVEQLQVWADRLKIPLYTSHEGADPASVAYQAYQQSKDADVLVIDTAGRLHNKKYLMDELEKIGRVLKKLDPDLPHEAIIVLDATTGQNALHQVDVFSKTIPLTGIILTKLDGTAKGGILVALAEQYKLPIYAIGVGEGFDDMQPFDAREFAKSLVGLA